MNEQAIKTEARLYVLECFAASQLAMFVVEKAAADPLQAFAKVQEQLVASCRRQTFPGLNSALSDHLSGEIEIAALALAKSANEQIALLVTRGR